MIRMNVEADYRVSINTYPLLPTNVAKQLRRARWKARSLPFKENSRLHRAILMNLVTPNIND